MKTPDNSIVTIAAHRMTIAREIRALAKRYTATNSPDYRDELEKALRSHEQVTARFAEAFADILAMFPYGALGFQEEGTSWARSGKVVSTHLTAVAFEQRPDIVRVGMYTFELGRPFCGSPTRFLNFVSRATPSCLACLAIAERYSNREREQRAEEAARDAK